MTERNFSLRPFSTDQFVHSFQIQGNVARRFNRLVIRWETVGPLAELVIPEPADVPVRKNGLWEETCYELFLAVGRSTPYWEFNLSPAGHWNVYRFATYRQGMQEETAYSSLPFTFQSRSDFLRVDMEVDLAGIIPPTKALEVGVSTVFKHRSGQLSYWALDHTGAPADFHRRESFLIGL